MVLSLLALSVIAAQPVATPQPQLELVIPQQMLEDFLEAAAPIHRTATQKIEVLGITQTLKADLMLTRPRVKVTPKGVFVTMDYDLSASGGITSNGRATSRLDLRCLTDKDAIEAKLVDTQLSGSDLTLGFDELLEPIQLPAGITGPLELGENKVVATGRAREVVLEDGQVRVRGDWEFKKPSPKKKQAMTKSAE